MHRSNYRNCGASKVVGVDDPEVSRNKPHPDPYLVAIKRFGSEDQPPPPPSQVLAFEVQALLKRFY